MADQSAANRRPTPGLSRTSGAPVARVLLLKADVVLGETALSRRPPKVDEIDGRSGRGWWRKSRIERDLRGERMSFAIAGLALVGIEAVELMVGEEAQLQGMPLCRVTRIELFVKVPNSVRMCRGSS